MKAINISNTWKWKRSLLYSLKDFRCPQTRYRSINPMETQKSSSQTLNKAFSNSLHKKESNWLQKRQISFKKIDESLVFWHPLERMTSCFVRFFLLFTSHASLSSERIYCTFGPKKEWIMALFVILCTFSYFEQMQLGFKMEKKVWKSNNWTF